MPFPKKQAFPLLITHAVNHICYVINLSVSRVGRSPFKGPISVIEKLQEAHESEAEPQRQDGADFADVIRPMERFSVTRLRDGQTVVMEKENREVPRVRLSGLWIGGAENGPNSHACELTCICIQFKI